MRQSASSGSPLEPIMGFARAVRIGNIAAVAGTAPLGPNGETVGLGDVEVQTRRCLEISRLALEGVGVPLSAVIRTRILLTDITRWEEAARVHGEYFGSIRPVCTFVQVSGFVRPEWLVETEVDAVIGED